MAPAVLLGESLGNGTMMAWTLSEACFLQAAGRVVSPFGKLWAHEQGGDCIRQAMGAGTLRSGAIRGMLYSRDWINGYCKIACQVAQADWVKVGIRQQVEPKTALSSCCGRRFHYAKA